MKKLLFIITLTLLASCNLNKVNKSHGSLNLHLKQNKLIINESNKNDIIELLGPPSTVSQFNNNLWYYIERKVTNSSLATLGKEKTVRNNVLVLELDQSGVLSKKKLLNIDKMNELKFAEGATEVTVRSKNFLYNFFNSIRQKINEPIKKAVQKKQIN